MSKDRYTVDSDFDDLHGDPAEVSELEVDLSDSDNPIIQAFVTGKDDDYVAPDKDDKPKKKKGDDEDKFIDDDEDDDDLEELDDDDDGDDDGDDGKPKKKKRDDDDDDEDADDDDEDDDEDDGEDDDDKKSWSKKVQARIDRERDLRVSDNADSNRRIANLERENKLFRAQSKFKEEQADADSKLRKLRKEKTEAIEEGNTSKQVDIDDEILDIKSDRKVKQFELKQLEGGIDDDSDDAGGRGTPPAGLKWLDKYPQYHTNKQFQTTGLQADKMVASRGFDRNTDKYYLEIEKILRPQFPEIIKNVKSTKKPKRRAPKKRGRSAVGGTQRAGTKRTRRGVIRLTKNDQEQMEVFGMDPKNVKDVKAWADSKAGK